MALLHYTATPVLGGVEAILESHRQVLSGAGYDVHVVAGRGDAEVVPELDSRYPEVEALTKRLAAGDAAESEFGRLAGVIREKLDAVLDGIDLVIAHNVMTMHFNLPLAAALAGRRVLAWTHDLAWTNPRYTAFHRDGNPYSLLHEPALGARYTAISERVQSQLAETYGVSAVAVPNGIDRARLLRIRPTTLTLLEPAGILEAGPLVLVR